MHLNPWKYDFGVDSGKLLGFMISNKGIEVDDEKMDAIINIPPSWNISQVCSLQGKIQAIRRFVSNLVDCMITFTSLLKKDTTFSWNDDCNQTFE